MVKGLRIRKNATIKRTVKLNVSRRNTGGFRNLPGKVWTWKIQNNLSEVQRES